MLTCMFLAILLNKGVNGERNAYFRILVLKMEYILLLSSNTTIKNFSLGMVSFCKFPCSELQFFFSTVFNNQSLSFLLRSCLFAGSLRLQLCPLKNLG